MASFDITIGRDLPPAETPAPQYAPARQSVDRRQMHSRVDAAQTTHENKNHWAQADALGPNAAFNETTRGLLRNRGRYEGLNNGYAHGLTRTLAYDLIGTVPRPQITIPGDDGTSANIVERNHIRWGLASKIGLKYRLMEKGAVPGGDVFGVMTTNPRLKNPVLLDVLLLESEQCCSPWGTFDDPYLIDGIRFDQFGNPLKYYFLKQHPGELTLASYASANDFNIVDADRVVHWFEQDRPGQVRGIPKITSSLPLFAQLRRYTLATLTASEFAAMLAGVMKTNLAVGQADIKPVDQWTLFELVRGALLTLPEGWSAEQFEPNQPTTTYEMFKREVLNEAGRGPGAPLNVVTGNSSLYNFSSGRLDHVPYHKGMCIDRYDFRLRVLDPVLHAWYAEAVLVGQVPKGLPPIEEWTWSWIFDGFGSIDPVKDANADDTRIKDGTSCYSTIIGEGGDDWQEHFDQVAREKAYAESKGLPYPLLFDKPVPTDKPAPKDMEEVVQSAMEQAGIPESQAQTILDELAPTLARFKVNGHSRMNGHALAGGVN